MFVSGSHFFSESPLWWSPVLYPWRCRNPGLWCLHLPARDGQREVGRHGRGGRAIWKGPTVFWNRLSREAEEGEEEEEHGKERG